MSSFPAWLKAIYDSYPPKNAVKAAQPASRAKEALPSKSSFRPYAIPSMRVRHMDDTAKVSNPPAPMPAPEITAETRLAICEACPNSKGDICRLFGCCNNKVSEKVKWALSQCPDNPPRWLRLQPKKS